MGGERREGGRGGRREARQEGEGTRDGGTEGGKEGRMAVTTYQVSYLVFDSKVRLQLVPRFGNDDIELRGRIVYPLPQEGSGRCVVICASCHIRKKEKYTRAVRSTKKVF